MASAQENSASLETTGSTLSAWDRVKLARNPARPHTLDYIADLVTDFIEFHGDRSFGDDPALVSGIGTLAGQTVMVLGHQKGTNTRENIMRNFGMARPEGYRKANRLMQHAAKFGIPVVTFIDTPGAEPGIDSEERGQATAIAESLLTMAGLPVPIVACVIGEGGSGGALAIGVADRIIMLENAIYAVATPEACAAILWKDATKAPEAAETMRVTAAELHGFGLVDEVVAEPVPANEAQHATMKAVGEAIARNLDDLLRAYPPHEPTATERMLEDRYWKFRKMGAWRESLQRQYGLPVDEPALA